MTVNVPSPPCTIPGVLWPSPHAITALKLAMVSAVLGSTKLATTGLEPDGVVSGEPAVPETLFAKIVRGGTDAGATVAEPLTGMALTPLELVTAICVE